MSIHPEITGHLFCAIPFPEPQEITKRIQQRFPNLRFTYRTSYLSVNWDKERLLPDDAWKDVTILCTLSEFPKHPSLAPSLEMIHLVCTGTNHMWDLPIYNESTVPITSATGISGPMIAEWVIMTSLVASRKYDVLHDWQKAHAWDEAGGGKALFQTVSSNVGKRMGILGYGAVGRQVGRLAKAMGMDVVVFTANPRTTPESRKDRGYIIPGTGDPNGEFPSEWYSGHDKASLHHFLEQDLDQLLISVTLTKASKHLLGKREFEILAKRNAFVINIARGDIVVQEDLIEALSLFEKDTSCVAEARPRRGLRGAALDVTTPEPLPPNDPLWNAPNCIITPHMSCVSEDYSLRAFEILELNLERKAKGLSLVNEVDRSVGYATKTST